MVGEVAVLRAVVSSVLQFMLGHFWQQCPLPCWAVDAMHSKKMFHEVIFPMYDVPRIVISDGGSHFIDQTF
jgi:hypothetical protein